MKYGSVIESVKNEIYPFVHRSKGNVSFALIWDLWYKIRLFKYVHYKQIPQIRSTLKKTRSRDRYKSFEELGYMKEVSKDVYIVTDKALPVLQDVGYNIETLPAQPKGLGNINELLNTDVFIQALKLPNFYTLLYHKFSELEPDALLVLKEEGRYKLTFLEIEAKKPSWEQYLENKRDKYLRLASNLEFL